MSRGRRAVAKARDTINSTRDISIAQTKTPPPEGSGVLFDRDT
jgi:hypothetical protein